MTTRFWLRFDRPALSPAVLPDPPGNWDPALVHPNLRERVGRVHARFPLWIASGGRTSEQQRALYDCYRSGVAGCSPANPPGSSNHEAEPWGELRALAVDMHPLEGSDYATMQAVAHEEGLHFVIQSERWHAQPVECPQGYWTGFPPGW